MWNRQSRLSFRAATALLVLTSLIVAGCSSSSVSPTPLPAGWIQVRPGDTLYRLAQQHQRPVACFQRANPQMKPNALEVGQRLRVPSVTECGLSSSTPASSRPAVTRPTLPPVQQEVRLPAGIGNFAWPVRNGQVTREFGADTRGRLQPMLIRAGADKTARAARAGTVQFADNMRQLGRVVIVHHDHNMQSVYAQCGTLSARVGQRVSAGTPLCQISQDDTSPTFTLLFDVRYAGNPIDPRRLLK